MLPFFATSQSTTPPDYSFQSLNPLAEPVVWAPTERCQ